MAENKNMNAEDTILRQVPWLTEDEIQSILATDADDEFDRLLSSGTARHASKAAWRRLWPAAVAASIVAATLLAWPGNDGGQAVAYIYGTRVDDEQVVMDMMQATLAEAFAPTTSMEVELNDILAQ